MRRPLGAELMLRTRDGLGNCLGRMIYQRGLSDAELAAQVGITRAQLNRIRNARAVPRVSTAIALAAALGCRVKDVFCLATSESRRARERG